MTKEVLKLLINPLLDVWSRIATSIPDILTALIFMLIGLFLARAVRTLLERLFKKINLDEHTSKIGINEILARFGFGKSPGYVIIFIAYWSILFVFMVSAANAINLTAVSALIEWFLRFLPRLAIAVIISFGGLLFAKFAEEVVYNSATANNLRGGLILSRVVHAVIIVFASMMALGQIGIEMTLIYSSMNIILASCGLAFAIAMGLGSKGLVEEFLRDIFAKK